MKLISYFNIQQLVVLILIKIIAKFKIKIRFISRFLLKIIYYIYYNHQPIFWKII